MNDELDDVVWMTPSEAQDYLRISKTTLYDCMKDGRLPFFYIKGTKQRRLKKEDLDGLMVSGEPSESSNEGSD